MVDRPASADSDVWHQHRVAIVFAGVVFALTLLFGFALLLLKCLETRVDGDRHPGPSTEDRGSAAVRLTPAVQQRRAAMHVVERGGARRWWHKLTELLPLPQHVWPSSWQVDCELAPA